jgi:uncharacterized repeat protein (TIGR01451 family)
VIVFTASVKNTAADSATIPNTVTIGAASEGGLGASPSSDTLTVRVPDLSTSTKTDDDVDNSVFPGQTVTYTISVINTGTWPANGLTVTDTIDSDFGTPLNFGYTNCGTPGQSFSAPTLQFSSVDVAVATTCTITYDVDIDTHS